METKFSSCRGVDVKDVNVLGAGDTFASCFLHKLLQNEGDIHNWIEFAHLKTTEIIGK